MWKWISGARAWVQGIFLHTDQLEATKKLANKILKIVRKLFQESQAAK